MRNAVLCLCLLAVPAAAQDRSTPPGEQQLREFVDKVFGKGSYDKARAWYALYQNTAQRVLKTIAETGCFGGGRAASVDLHSVLKSGSDLRTATMIEALKKVLSRWPKDFGRDVLISGPCFPTSGSGQPLSVSTALRIGAGNFVKLVRQGLVELIERSGVSK